MRARATRALAKYELAFTATRSRLASRRWPQSDGRLPLFSESLCHVPIKMCFLSDLLALSAIFLSLVTYFSNGYTTELTYQSVSCELRCGGVRAALSSVAFLCVDGA